MFNNLKHTKNMYNNDNNFRGNGQNGQPRVNNNQGVRPAVNDNNVCAGTACDSNPGVFKVALQSVKSNPGKTAAYGGAIVTGASAIIIMARNIKNNGLNPKGWTFTGKTKKAKAEPSQAAAAATEEGKK